MATLALLTATPSLSQTVSPSFTNGNLPVAVAFGVGAVALLGILAVRRMIGDRTEAERRAADQIGSLRAKVDDYEALLAATRETTILWSGKGGPRTLGQPAAVLPTGRQPDTILDWSTWLQGEDPRVISAYLETLRTTGQGFDTILRSRDGRQIRAVGWTIGGGYALRLRPVLAPVLPDREVADATRSLLAQMQEPAYLLGADGRPVFFNAAYQTLAAAKNKPGAQPDELAGLAGLKLIEIALSNGRAGYLKSASEAAKPAGEGLQHIGGIIDALATPIAIFDAKRELVQANLAYATLWGLDPRWLKQGLDERAILDRLRTDGKLPNDPDYQGWRARHLSAYQLTAPREMEPWYLPDGRTIQVIAAPAGPKGGVIYVFEDITDQLQLKSQHRTLIDVQRSTLNALNEGVAVFGTNGRLTLSNPRLSSLWKLPTNFLDTTPHIDQIISMVASALPDDGVRIWRELKRGVVDLNPTREDARGRITRSDGRVIDYAVTRLPDGQTMMSFVDVTESSNYQRMLSERNEALETADRLKDAFVQNVSYELRSPLTNIIGFADLLGSEAIGPLNDRQRSYTDYIRASSTTLGLLIDNILDLSAVNAGIAELRAETQDVRALVDKAQAALAATFPEIDGEKALHLSVSVADDLPTMLADGTRIVQILYNLLSTAARFSEPGQEIHLDVRGRAGRIVFTIDDEGAAMSDELRALGKSGDFSQQASGRQRGAGLSLSIVRAFVHLHGGTITVEKRVPRGSRVVVSLPERAAGLSAAE